MDCSFASLGVGEEICKSICEIGWKEPTEIQLKTIKSGINGEDISGMAETGSGKTGAFLIPLLQRLVNKGKPEKFGLVLAPTRELVLQISDVADKLSKHIDVCIVPVYGGVDDVTQMAQLAKRPHLIIATPGRMAQLIRDAIGFDLKPVEVVVIDEADKMASVDFFNDISLIISQTNKYHQIMLFSATMPKNVEQFTSLYSKSAEIVQLGDRESIPEVLKEFLVTTKKEKKDAVLLSIFEQYPNQQTLIFLETCRDATIMADFLSKAGFSVCSAYGSMSQGDREKAFNEFREGKYQILVATNVVGRGVDMPNIDIVIHYDLPQTEKEYIHRSGRAGRAKRAGTAITIVTEETLKQFISLEKFLGRKIEKMQISQESIAKWIPKVKNFKEMAVNWYKKMSRQRK